MEAPANQYFELDNYKDIIDNIKYDDFELGQTDTYNEMEIKKTIDDKHDVYLLACMAIQMSVVGIGKKSFGIITYQDDKVDLKKYFDDNAIVYDSILGSKLESYQLTPRRIIRYFRYIIEDYLKRNVSVYTYLYKKYCPIKDIKYRECIFNGFEHIAIPGKDDDKINVLIKTYKVLDNRNIPPTNITERIIRVLVARGFNYETLIKIS
jgi:hypothetical protein